MTAAQVQPYLLAPLPPRPGIVQFQCPACTQPLGELNLRASSLERLRICAHCRFTLQCEEGIWRALAPGRLERFSRFIADYEFIRNAEGRGSHCPAYYLSLPDRDLTGRNSAQWRIRARTWRYIRLRILPELTGQYNRPLRILDLGAGNGWLSAQLAQIGHSSVAVDLLTNHTDGLAAAEHFRPLLPNLFPRIQAEHDRLPFADAGFDLVIFNASFHYSEDYERTLGESLRVLAPNGSILIADTPWYSSALQGEAMLTERRSLFAFRYGTASDAIPSLEYLTDHRLARLSATLHLRWNIHKPWYGLRWAGRPLFAKLRHRREPSRFHLYLATRA